MAVIERRIARFGMVGCNIKMTTAVPRIALATSATGPDPSVAGLAMLAGLTARRWRVQHFRTRACPTAAKILVDAAGLPGRHLDTWLMPPNVCRSLFAVGVGVGAADLGLVEGTLETSLGQRPCTANDVPGNLAPLHRILDLPIVSVLSVVGCDRGTFHLPHLPVGTEAVIIDGLEAPEDWERIGRLIRLTYGLPVVGAVDLLPEARSAVEAAPRGEVPRQAIEALGASFLRHADLKALAALATSRDYPEYVDHSGTRDRDVQTPCFRVAYARDEAFGCYFPDTFEALASLGADLVEFSPLRDDALPGNIDLVMIGCGMPDLYAPDLASNFSMMASLRQHVCRGRRIYTEGGGTAYLGRSMIIDGQVVSGVGILPFDAELAASPPPPSPVTRRLTHDCWLGPRDTVVRGYMSGRWTLRPSVQQFECPSCFGSLSSEGDIYFRHHAVGSLIHLHLAALPEVVAAFAGPHQPSLKRPSAVGLAEASWTDESEQQQDG